MTEKQQEQLTLVGIFILALIVRLLFIVVFGAAEQIYDSLHDQYIYIDLAKSILAGRGFSMSFDIFVADAYEPTAIQQPLYPLLLAVVFFLFGESYLAVRILQAILSAGTCVIMYLIAKPTLGSTVSRLTALILCIYPLSVMYIRPMMSETLYTFLLSLVVLSIAKVVPGAPRVIHIIVPGVLFGLMFLIRPEILILAPMMIVFVVTRLRQQKQRSLRSILAGCAIAGLAFGITISPWAVRNWYAFGEPLVVPSKRWGMWAETWLRYMRDTSPGWAAACDNELECAIPNFDQRSELERDRYTAELARSFIAMHPELLPRYAVSRFFRSYPIIPREELPPPLGYKGVKDRPQDGYDPTSLDDVPLYVTGIEKVRVWSFRILLAGAVLGLTIAVRRRARDMLLPALLICFSAVTALLLAGTERYRLPTDPFLILAAAYGFVSVAAYLRKLYVLRQADPGPMHKAS
jgi:glycerol uptake facilitator-like aquaporin